MKQSSSSEPDETCHNARPDQAEIYETELFGRLKETHTDVPDELIADQVGYIAEGLGLLGHDPELVDTAEEALDSNLNRLGTALREGAGLAADAEPGTAPPDTGADDDAAADRIPPGNTRDPRPA